MEERAKKNCRRMRPTPVGKRHCKTMKTLTMKEAAAAIRKGLLVVYPTETFYALGCDALNIDAVDRVYESKQRSQWMPLPVIVGDMKQLAQVAVNIPDLAAEAIRRFWPGPLTVLLTASRRVPENLSGGTGKIAVRLSSHAGASLLCLESERPLVSSSANISGKPPVYAAKDLDPDITRQVDGGFLVFAPKPRGGLPSTIVECVKTSGTEALKVLRQGAVSLNELKDAGFQLA